MTEEQRDGVHVEQHGDGDVEITQEPAETPETPETEQGDAEQGEQGEDVDGE
jgi:hypothetical protein